MSKVILAISILLLCLVPTASLGNEAQSSQVIAESGFWPNETADCEAYSRTSQCHYLLCVCYSGCNTETRAIDLRKKNLCDGQFKRCLADPYSIEF